MNNIGSVIFILAVLAFVAFWIVGGVFFAVIANSRFMRVHKVRFSCIFSLLSIGTAYGASWMAVRLVEAQRAVCLIKLTRSFGFFDLFQHFIPCASNAMLESGLLWFALLLALGMGAMLASWSEE